MNKRSALLVWPFTQLSVDTPTRPSSFHFAYIQCVGILGEWWGRVISFTVIKWKD